MEKIKRKYSLISAMSLQARVIASVIISTDIETMFNKDKENFGTKLIA